MNAIVRKGGDLLTLGKQIRKLRKHNNMTQETLGNILGLGKSTISQYENDINTPDIKILQKISDIFDVSVDYILGNTEERKTADEILNQEKEVELEALFDRFNIQLEGKNLTENDKQIIISVLRSIKNETDKK